MLAINNSYYFWIISILTHGVLILVLFFNLESEKKSSPLEMIAVEWLSPSSQVGNKQKEIKKKKNKIENKNETFVTKKETNEAKSQDELIDNESGINEYSLESMTGEGGGIQTPRSLYFGEVSGLLNRNKRYPPMARQLGIQGVVKVKLKVSRSGEVALADVISFDHEILKQAAIRMIEEIKKFPPPTFEIKDEAFFVSVPIRYRLR